VAAVSALVDFHLNGMSVPLTTADKNQYILIDITAATPSLAVPLSHAFTAVPSAGARSAVIVFSVQVPVT
jgi:hypothetical protein